LLSKRHKINEWLFVKLFKHAATVVFRLCGSVLSKTFSDTTAQVSKNLYISYETRSCG